MIWRGWRRNGVVFSKGMKTRRPIESLILLLRGQKVILDADLAELYDVATHRFNEAVKRNRRRFPGDFAFSTHGRRVCRVAVETDSADRSTL